jgi:hypothetical protein
MRSGKGYRFLCGRDGSSPLNSMTGTKGVSETMQESPRGTNQLVDDLRQTRSEHRLRDGDEEEEKR